jgi:hypothetical protein
MKAKVKAKRTAKSKVSKAPKTGIVQARNPMTKRYIKIDRIKHRILAVTKTDKPFANVPIIRKKK